MEKTRNWYGRFERPISSLSLISGFLFDIVTLKRLDTLWENVWILGHITIVALFMALIHIEDGAIGDEGNPQKKHFWYVNIIQFFFGGLLSAYIVFYFRSTDIFATWPFILILGLAFIANESLKRHYVRFSFQISLLFLSIYSFAIYSVPVLLHQIGPWIFLLSGLLSIIFIIFFILIIYYFKKSEFKESKKLITFLIISITIFINFLYFTNLIPPIPLSIKDAGVYHFIQKNQNGNYDVTYEDYGWINYFKLYKDFKRTSTSPIYAYSAIFSPTGLDINVIHEWQHHDKIQNKWITDSIINLKVTGGRDGGFRTYSMRSNLEYGKWRVNVKTLSGQIIGRIRFNVLQTDTEPLLTSDVKI